MLNYEFRLLFASKGVTVYDLKALRNGIAINGRVGSGWMPTSAVSYKTGTVSILNPDFNFNTRLNWGDTCTIYYRTNMQDDHNLWRFFFSGVLGKPEDSDSPSGDFSVDLTLFQVTSDNYYGTPLAIKQFKGQTILSALQSVLSDKIGLISLSPETQSRVIDVSLYCDTILDFLKKIQAFGGFAIKTDYGDINPINGFSQIFYIEERSQLKLKYGSGGIPKDLEKYVLNFIPQVTLEKEPESNTYLTYWDASTLFTTALKTGDSVTFRDRTGEVIMGVIHNIDYQFSNRNMCSSSIKILQIN